MRHRTSSTVPVCVEIGQRVVGVTEHSQAIIVQGVRVEFCLGVLMFI